MNIAPLILQIAALACEVFAAFGFFSKARVSWGWLGLGFWFASFMLVAALHPATAVH